MTIIRYERAIPIEGWPRAAIYGNTAGFNNLTNGDCSPCEDYLALGPCSFCTGHAGPHGKTSD